MHDFQEQWQIGSMLTAAAFGSAYNTYPNLDYSRYHKNLIQ